MYNQQTPPPTPLYVQPETQNAQYPLIGNQYGSPATNVPETNQMPYTIVINQQEPSVLINPNIFKTTPISINCTICHKPITTSVTQEFNFCACLLCWCTGLICYVLIQAIRGKDICCYDATHRCPYCNNIVGMYQAC